MSEDLRVPEVASEVLARATTSLPGRCLQRAIITEECRANRGDEGAWDEAVARLRREYEAALAGWEGRRYRVHAAITIEPVG